MFSVYLIAYFICFLSVYHSFSLKQFQKLNYHHPTSLYMTNTITSDNEQLVAWKNGFKTCPKEICITLSNNFSLPLFTNGTYYRNGPAQFELTNKQGIETILPLDGDGMIVAITFNQGNITLRNRFIKTKTYAIEKKRPTIQSRGIFGTKNIKNNNILSINNIKNPASTNIIYWSERLLALWEGGRPHLLEPDSLRTISEYTLRNAKLTGSDSCVAHPRYDTNKQHIIFYTKSMINTKKSPIIVYEYDKQFNPIYTCNIDIPGYISVHDFIVTKNYYILYIESLKLDALPFVLGNKVCKIIRMIHMYILVYDVYMWLCTRAHTCRRLTMCIHRPFICTN